MMNPTVIDLVRERAGNRCEYCRLQQEDDPDATFHVEHIVAKKHRGEGELENLCLACPECNLHKGPNLAGLLNGKLYPLFSPRKQDWNRHFEWDGTTLVGKTATGVVTVQVLAINDPKRVAFREALLFEGRFPPDDH
jgi:hypothetical protein